MCCSIVWPPSKKSLSAHAKKGFMGDGAGAANIILGGRVLELPLLVNNCSCGRADLFKILKAGCRNFTTGFDANDIPRRNTT
jgi:hypothetical protein